MSKKPMDDDLRTLVAMLATWLNAKLWLAAGASMERETLTEYVDYTVEGLSMALYQIADSRGYESDAVLREMKQAMSSLVREMQRGDGSQSGSVH